MPIRRLLLCLVAAMVAAACSNPSNLANPSNPDATPSCLPPGYIPQAAMGAGTTPSAVVDERGEELDVKMAVVEGEVLTRRRLTREVGGLAPGQDQASLERQVHQRLLQRARLIIFAKEAQRAGVTIRDQMLEEVVAEELESRTKLAAEEIGEPVTIEEYLEERGLTEEEFRERVREELYFKAYVIRLQRGIGGPTRALVDMDVSPAEVRRIYWGNQRAFDEQPAVRFAAFQFTIEEYLVGDVGFLDAEEKALEDAAKLRTGLERGEAPAALAARFKLGGNWKASPEGKFSLEEGPLQQILGEDAVKWLFTPERRPGEAVTVPSAEGPIVVALLEKKPGRRVPYDEAYDKIVEMVRWVREQRLVEQRLIEILSTRDVVEPPSLAAELLMRARVNLGKLDRDPVFSAARFR